MQPLIVYGPCDEWLTGYQRSLMTTIMAFWLKHEQAWKKCDRTWYNFQHLFGNFWWIALAFLGAGVSPHRIHVFPFRTHDIKWLQPPSFVTSGYWSDGSSCGKWQKLFCQLMLNHFHGQIWCWHSPVVMAYKSCYYSHMKMHYSSNYDDLFFGCFFPPTKEDCLVYLSSPRQVLKSIL